MNSTPSDAPAPRLSPLGTLAARGLRPASELAARRPHGDRLRYIGGCRCDECRRANSAYERERIAARKAGDWNGLVCASKARAHLAHLSEHSVGRRTVADVSGVADTTLVEIIAGRKTRVRARTERAILRVTATAAADGALVSAQSTWRLLGELVRDGYSKTALAKELGYTRPALQFSRHRVTVRNRFDVERLHTRLHFVDARAALHLVAELRAEGFRDARVVEEMTKLAADEACALRLSLEARNGRMHHGVVRLIEHVHALITA